jgi:hypothetical protein
MVLRMQIEIHDEDLEPLRALAWKEHRSVREQGGFLLHLKIQEELQKMGLTADSPAKEVA